MQDAGVVAADHPKLALAFFAAAPVSDAIVEAISDLVSDLAGRRPWVNGPPQFVDVEDATDPAGADESVRSVGGYIEVYSSWPSWG